MAIGFVPPESKIVDTAASFRDKFIEVKDAVTHSHGKQGGHSHNGTAFTTWIDFQQAIAQADAICSALQTLEPDAIEQFALNFDILKKELFALDSLRAIPNTGYTKTGDGQRFLFVTSADEASVPPCTVVLNWMAEVKK